MRYFYLLCLSVFLTHEARAFACSDTLIIDGQVVYVEERVTAISDSLNNARRNDFKEKRKVIEWGIDASYGLQLTDFSISRSINSELLSVGDFLELTDKTFYHSGFASGLYARIHRSIEIGISIQGAKGVVSESSAEGLAAFNTLSFYSSQNQIQQVALTEVQPQVFELDTIALTVGNANFDLTTFQIPFKCRFFVNDFTLKSRWKAFGEISPVYRSFSLKSRGASNPLLFLNTLGDYEYVEIEERKWSSFGVLVGVGSEFQMNKRMNAFVQANWNFPPVNSSDASGINYFTQYSSLFVGIRVQMNKGK